MKKKTIPFDPEALVSSVETVRDVVAGRRKLTLRTTTMPKPAPALSAQDVQRIRETLQLSQPVFAALLNVPTVTATSWEKGRRKPSGAALRLLQIARTHPEWLGAA